MTNEPRELSDLLSVLAGVTSDPDDPDRGPSGETLLRVLAGESHATELPETDIAPVGIFGGAAAGLPWIIVLADQTCAVYAVPFPEHDHDESPRMELGDLLQALGGTASPETEKTPSEYLEWCLRTLYGPFGNDDESLPPPLKEAKLVWKKYITEQWEPSMIEALVVHVGLDPRMGDGQALRQVRQRGAMRLARVLKAHGAGTDLPEVVRAILDGAAPPPLPNGNGRGELSPGEQALVELFLAKMKDDAL